VEDEPALRKAAKKTLELVGYRVLLATDGVEGLRVFGENREEIDLVVTDLIMPRMGGRGLYHAIKDQGHGVRFLFASGYDTETSTGERDLREVLPFIEKPWTIQEFTEKVRGVLDQNPPT
jgi:DNA-binding NtrC family response regulator